MQEKATWKSILEDPEIIVLTPAINSWQWKIFSNLFLNVLSLFTYFERERERAGVEGEPDRIPRRLHTGSVEPDMGLKRTNRKIRTWAEPNVRHLTDLATQVPLKDFIFVFSGEMISFAFYMLSSGACAESRWRLLACSWKRNTASQEKIHSGRCIASIDKV